MTPSSNGTIETIEESRRRFFLFSCMESHGHLNALMGIANYLKGRGHRTAFLLKTGNFKLKDHEVFTIDSIDTQDPAALELAKEQEKVEMQELMKSFSLPRREIWEKILVGFFPNMFKGLLDVDHIVSKMLKEIKPDVVIYDYLCPQPALAGHPKCITVWSANPLILWSTYYEQLPPGFYGLPVDSPKELIEEYRKSDRQHREAIHKMVKEALAEYKCSLADGSFYFESKLLNIYQFPSVLDYSDVCNGSLPDNYLRCDDLVRREFNSQEKQVEFTIPESLAHKTGKLIYVSMGTLASMNVDLMKRLVSYLTHSPHRFIFSKGINHDKYELNESNMWGDKYVDQLAILQKIDLIITHGGNNTLTETLYYGVPGIIVCPCFGDQHDNGQRIQEKGLGVRIDIFHATQEELLGAIEKVLADQELKEKIKQISKVMRSQNCIAEACVKIEEIANL